LLNHRTYYDWLFLWSWVLRFGRLINEKIVLKKPLKLIPGPGWAMQLFLFLFLNRRWEADKVNFIDNLILFFISFFSPFNRT